MLKLEAVNIVLTRNGLKPSPSLDTNGASEAAEIERLIDETSLEVQSEGWWFNIYPNVTLNPNGLNQIELPVGCITIDTYGTDAWRKVTQRGGMLYDIDNNTSSFTASLVVEYTLLHDWACIPDPVQRLIAETGACRYDLQRRGGARQAILSQHQLRARVRAKQFDNRTSDRNMLDGPEADAARGGRPRILRT